VGTDRDELPEEVILARTEIVPSPTPAAAGRSCPRCGAWLSRTNPGPRCYPCQRAEPEASAPAARRERLPDEEILTLHRELGSTTAVARRLGLARSSVWTVLKRAERNRAAAGPSPAAAPAGRPGSAGRGGPTGAGAPGGSPAPPTGRSKKPPDTPAAASHGFAPGAPGLVLGHAPSAADAPPGRP
jgi:hypothetical protein